MSEKVLELRAILGQDEKSRFISNAWNTLNFQRQGKINEWLELRNYIFATSTKTTSNAALPWKNSTTTPKLCQIRDNLHSNYLSALFPNDDWLQWEAGSADDASKNKATVIRAYMLNKLRQSHFRTEMSKLIYDYIDYGNAFATVSFENSQKVTDDGERIPNYIGPRVQRISPLDIVFNPQATDITKTYKIVRSVKTIGELRKLAEQEPEQSFWAAAIERRDMIRRVLGGGIKMEDFNKAVAYQVDGFGNLFDYYMGNSVEILEFFGDYNDESTGENESDRIITVVDRSITVRDVLSPTWFGHIPIYHVGWRFRQDNLWAMGPLDNLVGMQYRIDHLENLKADAMDLVVMPPLLVAGDVEEFEWKPYAEIHVSEGGAIKPLSSDMNAIVMADNNITELENKMELYAGAPRQAMGIRTPGEKTAFEVQTLENAAGRIFQEKTQNFEIELMEPCLNAMLETSKRNMDGSDVIRVLDKDLGVVQFQTITKADIVSTGKLRPVGARHFAKQAQDMQNLVGILSGPVGQLIAPHISSKALASFVGNVVDLTAYQIFRPNVAIDEKAETQSLANQAQEDLQTRQAMPGSSEI